MRYRHFATVTTTLAVLACSSLTTACGGSDATGPGAGSGQPGEETGGFVPAALVGEWNYGSISPTNFWNDHTGQYGGNAYGVGAWFTFEADGGYRQFIYQYTRNYNCEIQVWTSIRGGMDVQDNVITFSPTSGEYQVADNCVAAHNYRRDMTSQEIAAKQNDQWEWSFETNPYDHKTYLMMGWAGSGSSYPFDKN